MKKTFLFLLLACSFFANGQSGVNKKLVQHMMMGGGSASSATSNIQVNTGVSGANYDFSFTAVCSYITY